MGKPTTKSNKVNKLEVSKPSVRSRSESKTECKFESKTENNESKKLGKEDCDDTSILHPSIDVSVSGLRQASKIFEKGTAEIQDLLSFECDVIYECKICRNLFRSVANFISHKRIYCTTQYQTCNELLSLNNKLEDFYNSLDPGDAVHPNTVKNKLKNPSRMNIRPNLAAVINSCVNFPKPVQIRSSRNGCGANGNYSLHLQAMEESKAGVFQTFVSNSSEGQRMSMRDQMQELYSSQRGTAIIESDLGSDNGYEFTNGISDSESNRTYTCDQCGLPCASVKTLMRHKKLIHETAKTCYLCPCCKSSFPNTWSVHRHLFKAHHKTNEQVRKLRSQIKSKVMLPGEVGKGMADKIKMVPQKVTDQQRSELENEEWLDQMGKDVDLLRCGICGRKFERRAALKAHYQICQKRVAPAANPVQYRATPEREINHSEPKAKTLNDFKLHPVVTLTALTPQQIKDNLQSKSCVPEKKIGIQVRMDYCKKSSSHIADATSEISNRLTGFSKPNPIEVITIDDDRRIEKPKSCLETLLTENRALEKRKNRSDSGNDSESLDDISVALDFSSDSVVDEDAIKLNMYDILGISYSGSNTDNMDDGSLNVESSNSTCDDFSSEDTNIPNKRKKSLPVKRFLCSAVDRLKFDCDNVEVETDSETNLGSRTDSWSEKSADMDCVFRKEGVRVTYTNCKSKNCRPEQDRISNGVKPSNFSSEELIEKVTDLYDKTKEVCLLCDKKFNSLNILYHITEHGSWLKFLCKWPKCDHKSTSKTEMMKHIIKEHQSTEETAGAHDFIELISTKDWTFQKSVVKNHLKKPSLLLSSVNKLKEKLNCLENPPEHVVKEEDRISLNEERTSPEINNLPPEDLVEDASKEGDNVPVAEVQELVIDTITKESEIDCKNCSVNEGNIDDVPSNEDEMVELKDSAATENSVASNFQDLEMNEQTNAADEEEGVNDCSEDIVNNDNDRSFGGENIVIEDGVELDDSNHSTEKNNYSSASPKEIKVDAPDFVDEEDHEVSSVESCSEKNDLSEGENSNLSVSSEHEFAANSPDSTVVVEEMVEEEVIEETVLEEEVAVEEVVEEEVVCDVDLTSDYNVGMEESSNEKSARSPVNSLSCDTPLTSYEDDVLSDSHCEDLVDTDPSCTVLDKSEAEVELDDDHLRAVMMEMIFGQPNNEATVGTSTEFSAKNMDGSKKRKLDAGLNV